MTSALLLKTQVDSPVSGSLRLLLEGLAIKGLLATRDLFVDGVGFFGFASLTVGVGDAAIELKLHITTEKFGRVGFGLALVKSF